jgi:hypothetical protein
MTAAFRSACATCSPTASKAGSKGHYTDGDFYDGSFSASIGGQFKFNPTWGVVGEIEAGDDLSTFMIGARASF